MQIKTLQEYDHKIPQSRKRKKIQLEMQSIYSLHSEMDLFFQSFNYIMCFTLSKINCMHIFQVSTISLLIWKSYLHIYIIIPPLYFSFWFCLFLCLLQKSFWFTLFNLIIYGGKIKTITEKQPVWVFFYKTS